MKTVQTAAAVALAVLVSITGVTPSRAGELGTLVDVAIEANEATGLFDTLIAALITTGLDEVLAGEDNFTAFAPTDPAFAKLGLNENNVHLLPKDVLSEILLYHVTPGKKFSGDVLPRRILRMANGAYTVVYSSKRGAFINRAELQAPDFIDIEADNGVIHVINRVLIPYTLFTNR